MVQGLHLKQFDSNKGMSMESEQVNYIRQFNEIGIHDVALVGGKNASLGEMFQALRPKGINIPDGFVITADAFTKLFEKNNLQKEVYARLLNLDVTKVDLLEKAGREIRDLIRFTGLPEDIKSSIKKAYMELCHKTQQQDIDVAVRSSATAEDLPEASFAGQQETFLNVKGENDLLQACLNCFASLFTDRAISYRDSNNFDHRQVRLSIGIQQMVRSDLASSGVIFTLDTESGARNVILLTSSYGLGENIVGGRVDPDEFVLLKPLLDKARMPILRRKLGAKQFRLIYSTHGSRRTKNIEVSQLDQEHFSLNDQEVIKLAQWARMIELYYSEVYQKETPMDIEWAKDGRSGELFIVQARPESVHSNKNPLENEVMTLTKRSQIILTGKAVGAKIGAGPVRIITNVDELSDFKEGEILVADMTDPDWEPVMKKAAGIITNRGGRTCHAAIVSREHGVPCIVGTGNGTEKLKTAQNITMSCAEGEEGVVFEGILPFTKEKLSWSKIPKTKAKVMVNVANPEQALKTAQMPVDGVGLARMEFIIAERLKVHPMALIHREKVKDEKIRLKIEELIKGFEDDPTQFFIKGLAEGIGMIAGAFYPRPVIVRLSDFKTNEYANLLGGEYFEPKEENPMIGFRGASRYYSPLYREGFALECQAIKFVREEMGLSNVKIMVPFCRTFKEGELVINELARNGLRQSKEGLEVYVMCEIPSNVLDLKSFAKIFDGFSIGSNDLTQMTLGVDRDSELLSHIFDERDPAVLTILDMAIQGAHEAGKHVGICGQAPSDYPEITKFLIERGINSLSFSSDSVLKALKIINEAEVNKLKRSA